MLPLAMVLGASVMTQPAEAADSKAGRQFGELDRIQMHGNRLRGVPYRPSRQDGGAAQPKTFNLRPMLSVNLDGDPGVNVRGSVYPIDVDGNGTFELVHFNGYRVMRVYAAGGKKLWQIGNPSGRVHRTASHSDTLAVLDLDRDGGQDIVHCWSEPGQSSKVLVARDGATGKVMRRAVLKGQGRGDECQVAAFRTAGGSEPIILVSASAKKSDGCKQRFSDVFSRTMAFRPNLTKAWDQVTCDAGHYVWPVDANADGRSERLFVGKYQFTADGKRHCTLPGFERDHLDSMTVADLDPKRPGLEVLAVGMSGTRFYSVENCVQRWAIPNRVITGPQTTTAANVGDGSGAGFRMMVTTKRSRTTRVWRQRTYVLDARGKVVSSFLDSAKVFTVPIAVANLDGATSAEDHLTSFGQVVDRNGRLRLGASWYWNLQQLTQRERGLPTDDLWASRPFAFDFTNDGRDELVVWGRHKIIVGTRRG